MNLKKKKTPPRSQWDESMHTEYDEWITSGRDELKPLWWYGEPEDDEEDK